MLVLIYEIKLGILTSFDSSAIGISFLRRLNVVLPAVIVSTT